MAPTTPRWFYEMGTPEGLVDFPALYRAMKASRLSGLGRGRDTTRRDIGGGNYPESTAAAAWYIQQVLSKACCVKIQHFQSTARSAGRTPSTRGNLDSWGFARLEGARTRAEKVTSALRLSSDRTARGHGTMWEPLGRPDGIRSELWLDRRLSDADPGLGDRGGLQHVPTTRAR